MCSINLCCRWSLFVAALLFSASVFVGCGDDGGGGPTGQPDAFTDTSSNDTGGSTEPPLDWYWQIGVSRASIPTTKPNGDSWDAFGGAPDPFVCLEIGTNQPICTVTLQDTFTPRWDSLSTASFTYAQLQDVNFGPRKGKSSTRTMNRRRR